MNATYTLLCTNVNGHEYYANSECCYWCGFNPGLSKAMSGEIAVTTPETAQLVPGTKAWLIDYFDKMVADMRATMIAKNVDYGGSGLNGIFANFVVVESLNVATTTQGFLTRMLDKFMRINTLMKQAAQVKSESIYDTLQDLAVYSILLSAYLKSQMIQTK